MERIKQIVKNRTVGILSHGKSIETLENEILFLKNYDICWAGFNYYQLLEEFILKKINKNFDIVLDCAKSENKEYEKYIRIPYIEKSIKNKTLVLSLNKLLDTWDKKDVEKYSNKIVLLDNYFDISKVANTMVLLIYSIAICKPKQIILFGADGCLNLKTEIESYYKPLFQLLRRFAIRGENISSINRETESINKNFYTEYEKTFNKYWNIPIYNCSDITNITVFEKIYYEEINRIL